MNKIKVAIALATFKHEEFISTAIEGILSQKTDFNFCAYIGDDASPDKTQEICQHYADKFPDKIKFLPRKKNNIIENSKAIYSACMTSEANYIALLDGDDFWMDPLKLQKQVDFLEANTEFSMCFTNHSKIDDAKHQMNYCVPAEFARNLSHEDVLANNYFIATATVLFKKGSVPSPLPKAFFESPNGDHMLYCYATQNGNAAFLDFSSATYRIHGNGTWTSQSTTRKYWAMYQTFLIKCEIFTSASEQKALKRNLTKILQNLSWAYFEMPKAEQLKFILKSLIISIRFGVFKKWLSINSELISLFLKNKMKLKIS